MFKYLPLSYLFASRLITSAERISWVIIYPMFLFFVTMLFDANAFHFIIIFLGVMSVYEIGYLYNDFVTIKSEVNPTVRNSQSKGFDEQYFLKLRNYRLFFTLFLSFLEALLFGSFYLFFSSCTVLFVYYFHNTIRSRINILTYFLLVAQRYVAPLLFFLDVKLLLIILFAFPVIRTMEHSCKIKYRLVWIQEVIGNPDSFRVFYYLLFLLITLWLYWLNFFDFYYVCISSYFFVYRLVSFFMRHKVKRQKHNAYKN